MKNLRLTYYPDITQGVTPEKVRFAVIVFAEALAEELSHQVGDTVNVIVPEVMTVSEQFQDIIAGQSQIALMKPVAYVLANQVDENILPACVAHRPIDGEVGVFYFAQLYVRAGLGIESLKDLKDYGSGKLTIAYGDRFSTSNFLIPANMLKKSGIHPFLHFKHVMFAGGHDHAARAVYDGIADIGAGHDGVIKILGKTQSDAEQKLKKISRENIHSDPVVVNLSSLPDSVSYNQIQTACGIVAKTDAGKEALDLFWGWVKDLSPTKVENYASIASAINDLNLIESDLL